jgi:uncharacterized protein (UPF0333 family)
VVVVVVVVVASFATACFVLRNSNAQDELRGAPFVLMARNKTENVLMSTDSRNDDILIWQ